jgi:hypothetical protein
VGTRFLNAKILAVAFLGIYSWTATAQEATPEATAQNGVSKDRLFFMLPNFLTLENAGEVRPMTARQKFKETARESFDYTAFVWYGVLAGIGQWKNDEPTYGQGAEGYAKRYGEAFADGTIENFATKAILPSVLHQDPRYFQMGTGGFRHRAWYAVSRTFITRGDTGHNQFNASEVFGAGGAAAVSTYSYHPADERNMSNIISVWGSQVGYDTISTVVKEFWPDIRRKLHKSN